jgi:hypothetical protein
VWLAAPGPAGHAFAGDGATLAFVSDYAAVNGGTFTGAQVFAAPRP